MRSRNSQGQVLVRRNLWIVLPLATVLGVTAALLVFELLKSNHHGAQLARAPWNVELLGMGPTVTLLATSLVALLGRAQYARSVRPLVGYESQWVQRPAHDLAPAARYREVRVQNKGTGTAIVAGLRWTVETEASPEVRTFTAIEPLRDALSQLELVEARDYSITNLSIGAVLKPDEEHLYFECTDVAVKTFRTFTVTLTIDSLLGDRFERAVSLLPHPGASHALAVERPDGAA